MSSTKPVVKMLERDGYCRVCDNVMTRNEDTVVSWWSSRNRGQSIHICIPCVVDLYKITNFHAMLNKDSV